MNIKLHKNDLPDDLDLGNLIAVDGEFMGLNIRRDPLCLIQISTGNSDAHIIQLNRDEYKAPNLVKILENEKIAKIFHYIVLLQLHFLCPNLSMQLRSITLMEILQIML